MENALRTERERYADELRYVGDVRSEAVRRAFATVPREHFVDPGPWRLLSPHSGEYWTTEDDDPRHLYHNVLIALDEARRINNGQPSLWAYMYDRLDIQPGEHVVHVGAGTGYYSAVLAELVGPRGYITAIEVDPDLGARATDYLAGDWPQAEVVVANGFVYRSARPVDVLIVNAGVNHLPMGWMDSLAVGGRALIPITDADGEGGFLKIERPSEDGGPYAASHLGRVGIFGCVGGRDPQLEAQLRTALVGGGLRRVRSWRRGTPATDGSCWLAGDGWWLSTDPAREVGRGGANPPLPS